MNFVYFSGDYCDYGVYWFDDFGGVWFGVNDLEVGGEFN